MEYFIGRLARPLVGGVLLHKTLDIITYCNHQTSIHFAIGAFCVSEFRDWTSRRLQDILRFVYTHVVDVSNIREVRRSCHTASTLPVIWTGLKCTTVVNDDSNTEVLCSNKWNAGNILRRQQKEGNKRKKVASHLAQNILKGFQTILIIF